MAAPGSLFARHNARRPPNIVFILADDLGWSELGCYGNHFNETPNLDRMAGEGVRFTDAYAAAPVCSPTRAALMTGQWPARLGITDYLRPRSDKRLPDDIITLPEALQAAGYATGIIGKWHLTGYQHPDGFPGRHGFDESILAETTGIGSCDYFHPYRFNPKIKKRLSGREHLVDRINFEAVDFIERMRDRPFFLFVSHHAVHTIIKGRRDLVRKYRSKPGAGGFGRPPGNNPHLAAQLEAMDNGVGMVMDALDGLSLADDTVVVFASDNGGDSMVTDNAPLREGKSHLYEGGVRVPLVVWGRGVNAGNECSTPTSTEDFYPTFLDMAGITPGPERILDGASLVAPLMDPDATPARDALFWHYPMARPHFLGGRSSGAVRQGEWKLIEFFDTGAVELYNLADDVGETEDLAFDFPERAEELRQRLVDWRDDAGLRRGLRP